MNLDLDMDLPEFNGPSFPPPHLDNERYLEFIELNRSIAREAGILERLIENRPRPSEEFFVLD